ncbi:MAG: HupE/UreJ family protein [Pseudomonadales bacterium]|nr:HupE/UreJ family protein [Pseudomonadales bacterium]
MNARPRWHLLPLVALLAVISATASAHDVPEAARQRLADGDWYDYVWTGAEHMLTGYDHLLFLFGVVFFLHRFTDIVKFITAFTVGHTVVLIGATPWRIAADQHLVDAFIAGTVVYKAFENLGGFQSLFRCQPPSLLAMVFLFGLAHGFGLSGQLQILTLADEPGLIGKILWFNLGVELGQIAALCVMGVVINAWRQTVVWTPLSRIANGAMCGAGLLLMLYQLHDYVHHLDGVGGMTTDSAWHSHGDDPPHRHD